MGIAGADLVIAAVGAGLRAYTRFARVEYANGEEVPAERFLAEVEGVVLETLLEKIFGMPGSGVAAVDGPSRFYVLWRYAYKAAKMEAGEAIVFTYGQHVELDGQKGLSTGRRALVEKKKGKYRLRDFTERGKDEKPGLPEDGGAPAPLIDVLHRILWLVENQPRALNKFLDEARPDRERLRLVAQALAGKALSGRNGDDRAVITTAAEQAALKKLLANWRALIDQRLAADEGTLFDYTSKKAGGESMSTRTLRPWTDLVKLHPDVETGALTEVVFAIDLGAIAAGDPNVPVVNRDPEAFFRATYLTADLRRLLEEVLASLAGKRGYNRVLKLRTPFGGGKSHTLASLLHAARHPEALDHVPEATGFARPKNVAVAVFDGEKFDARNSKELEGGYTVCFRREF